VILLRHGDKVASGDGNNNLSANGFLRSINLARLIPACFGTPTHIRTFFLNPVTSTNARSYQSAVPLGVATGVNISIAQSSLDNSFQDGREILQQRAYANGNVVLIWEHRRMHELARGWAGLRCPPSARWSSTGCSCCATGGPALPPGWRASASASCFRPHASGRPPWSTRA
jgi:hypothetical protein